jgi:hypothetical protein
MYVGSFNEKLRDERLNGENLDRLAGAGVVTER